MLNLLPLTTGDGTSHTARLVAIGLVLMATVRLLSS